MWFPRHGAGVDDLMKAIDAIARAQYGLVTRAQLLRVWTPKQIKLRLAQGLLILIRPNVYRVTGVPGSWRQRLLAVCLSYGGPTVASHRSATRLWLLDGVPSQKLEVTIPPQRSGRMPGVITHRSAATDQDMTRRFDVPVTTIERTLIDLSGVVSLDTLERALDDALRQGHTTITKLDRRLLSMGIGGPRRIRTLRHLVAERGPGYRPGDSSWEDRLYRWIVEARLPPPQRQCWVVVHAGQRRRLDLAYPAERIAIEYDGWDSHRQRRHFDDDRVRTIDLQLEGWLVLPFTSRSTADEVVAKVGRALATRRAGMLGG
jgi:very-short-patch-repair endonuclease